MQSMFWRSAAGEDSMRAMTANMALKIAPLRFAGRAAARRLPQRWTVPDRRSPQDLTPD
jgi:hypothetical protein